VEEDATDFTPPLAARLSQVRNDDLAAYISSAHRAADVLTVQLLGPCAQESAELTQAVRGEVLRRVFQTFPRRCCKEMGRLEAFWKRHEMDLERRSLVVRKLEIAVRDVHVPAQYHHVVMLTFRKLVLAARDGVFELDGAGESNVEKWWCNVDGIQERKQREPTVLHVRFRVRVQPPSRLEIIEDLSFGRQLDEREFRLLLQRCRQLWLARKRRRRVT
jgi:hypothetical protein